MKNNVTIMTKMQILQQKEKELATSKKQVPVKIENNCLPN